MLFHMLHYWTCSSIIHSFPSESLDNESNTGIKSNVNIWGVCVSVWLCVCMCVHVCECVFVWEWNILLWFSIWTMQYWNGPSSFTMPSQNKLHFKGSMLLLLKSVSVVQANTFCIDPPFLFHRLPPKKALLPFLPARLAFKIKKKISSAE